MKGVSFAMQVLIVVIIVLIVALVVLSIFAGGMQNIGTTLSHFIGGQKTCEDIGGQCQSGTACTGEYNIPSFGGSCTPGQICCVKPTTV